MTAPALELLFPGWFLLIPACLQLSRTVSLKPLATLDCHNDRLAIACCHIGNNWQLLADVIDPVVGGPSRPVIIARPGAGLVGAVVVFVVVAGRAKPHMRIAA